MPGEDGSSKSVSDQILFNDLLPEAEYVWVFRIDDCPDPMRVRVSNRLHSREVLNDPPAYGADQRFVDAKGVSVPVHVHHRLAEGQHLLFAGDFIPRPPSI